MLSSKGAVVDEIAAATWPPSCGLLDEATGGAATTLTLNYWKAGFGAVGDCWVFGGKSSVIAAKNRQ